MLYPAVRKCCCLYTMYHINNNAFSCVLKVVRLQSVQYTTLNIVSATCNEVPQQQQQLPATESDNTEPHRAELWLHFQHYIQWRRHRVDWRGHVHPTFARSSQDWCKSDDFFESEWGQGDCKCKRVGEVTSHHMKFMSYSQSGCSSAYLLGLFAPFCSLYSEPIKQHLV